MSLGPNHMLRMRSDYPGDKCSLGGCDHAQAQIARLVKALREAHEQITANMSLKDHYQEWDSETIAKIDALLCEYTPKEKQDE